MEKDLLDNLSLHVFAAPQNYTRTMERSFNRWAVSKIANQRYCLQNMDTSFYLSYKEAPNFKKKTTNGSVVRPYTRIENSSNWVYDIQYKSYWEIVRCQ
jgi:hypothetical protein